jgi:hypothetical protein
MRYIAFRVPSLTYQTRNIMPLRVGTKFFSDAFPGFFRAARVTGFAAARANGELWPRHSLLLGQTEVGL